MSAVRVARVHDPVGARPGRRFLVDLRRWSGHDVGRWPEFRRRYLADLEAAPDAVRPLLDAAREGDVVLLHAARDAEHNHAVVLREHLLATLGDG